MEPESLRCGDLNCPRGSVCARDPDRCVAPALVVACNGKRDGDPCTGAGFFSEFCEGGVCRPAVCGDGQITGAEVCDDGNVVACDGCSADCTSDESCGNLRVECGEQCDQGTQNSQRPDALCRPDCVLQHCGDGVVDRNSGEDCDGAPNPRASCNDYGYYAGELGCSLACRNDTATCVGRCGDGAANGGELCDGLPPTGESCLEYGYDVGNLGCSAFCTPAFDRCERIGFESLRLDVSAFLLWVWGSAPDDVYAVGETFALIHYDGREWSEVELGFEIDTGTALNGVWGSASDDVFVVGDAGAVLHYDGREFRRLESGTEESLKGVWGRSADDVFMVGDAGTILHYDGQRFQRMDSGVTTTLWNVRASPDGSVYAVGDARAVLELDGADWTPLEPPVAEDLGFYGIWSGDGAGQQDELFVSGDAGTIAHYANGAWELMDSGVPDEYLYAFWGEQSSDLYLSGAGGVVLHHDGRTWTRVATGTTQDVFSIWGSGDDDLFAVGPGTALYLGQGGPTLTRLDSGTGERLNGVWGESPAEVTIVGENGTILRSNGDHFEAVESPTTERLLWIWGSARDDVHVVGSAGTILHHDGVEWSLQDSPIDTELTAVWGSGPNDVFAVGDLGRVLHYDGAAWSVLESGTDAYLYNVWGSGPRDVFVAGSGTVLHYDGKAITPMELGVAAEFWGVWGTGPNDVYAFADVGGALHYDGERWSELTFRSSQALDFASGVSSTDLFSVTTFATALFHYDGLDFAPLRLPPETPSLQGLWMSERQGYVVGQEGLILRLERGCGEREKECSDRWDNDCDGLANCADPDCAGDSFCESGGSCRGRSQLACGDRLESSTLGAAPRLEVYGCDGVVATGREEIHRFEAPASTPVRVTLTSDEPELGLVVLAANASGACDPRDSCVASAFEASKREVEFDAEARATYFLIVDGTNGAAGDYDLEVACP